MVNPNMKTGDIELELTSFEILGKCASTLPFEINHPENASEETRLKYRYLLEAIIKEEKIEIKDKDIDKEIAKIAKNYNVTEEEIMKEFGSKEVLKYNMAMEKAVEVLKENN